MLTFILLLAGFILFVLAALSVAVPRVNLVAGEPEEVTPDA